MITCGLQYRQEYTTNALKQSGTAQAYIVLALMTAKGPSALPVHCDRGIFAFCLQLPSTSLQRPQGHLLMLLHP